MLNLGIELPEDGVDDAKTYGSDVILHLCVCARVCVHVFFFFFFYKKTVQTFFTVTAILDIFI
jgi:hypothetical protein